MSLPAAAAALHMYACCVCVCVRVLVCWLIKISCTRATLSSLFSHFALHIVLLLPLHLLPHAIKKLCLGVGICAVCLCVCVCLLAVSQSAIVVVLPWHSTPTSPLPPVLSALPAGKRKHNQKDNAIMPQWYNTYKNISRLCRPPTSTPSPLPHTYCLYMYVSRLCIHIYFFAPTLFPFVGHSNVAFFHCSCCCSCCACRAFGFSCSPSPASRSFFTFSLLKCLFF